MIERKSKIRFIQVLLLLFSMLIVLLTYFYKETPQEKIITSTDKEKIKDKTSSANNKDIFYNIKYSGLDLSGNRYILTSKEAMVDKNVQEIVNMKFVNAVFYFKDSTTLIIDSDNGIYNNKSLDMVFDKNVRADYEGSILTGEKIVYLNSKRMLEVSDNVRLRDDRGTIFADRVLFDLVKKKVDISSYKNTVKTNINLK